MWCQTTFVTDLQRNPVKWSFNSWEQKNKLIAKYLFSSRPEYIPIQFWNQSCNEFLVKFWFLNFYFFNLKQKIEGISQKARNEQNQRIKHNLPLILKDIQWLLLWDISKLANYGSTISWWNDSDTRKNTSNDPDTIIQSCRVFRKWIEIDPKF